MANKAEENFEAPFMAADFQSTSWMAVPVTEMPADHETHVESADVWRVAATRLDRFDAETREKIINQINVLNKKCEAIRGGWRDETVTMTKVLWEGTQERIVALEAELKELRGRVAERDASVTRAISRRGSFW